MTMIYGGDPEPDPEPEPTPEPEPQAQEPALPVLDDSPTTEPEK